MGSRESKNATVSIVFVLFSLLFATISRFGHHHWLIYVAGICWLAAVGNAAKIFDGVELPAMCIIGVVLAVVTFFFGAIFTATWVGAFVLVFLSVISLFLADKALN